MTSRNVFSENCIFTWGNKYIDELKTPLCHKLYLTTRQTLFQLANMWSIFVLTHVFLIYGVIF